MKLVTIKRATVDGAVVCTGKLYKYGGFQFCITKIDGLYAVIEISTGLKACSAYSLECKTDRMCINSCKKWIKNNISLFSEGTLERSKKLLSKYGYKYPLNVI